MNVRDEIAIAQLVEMRFRIAEFNKEIALYRKNMGELKSHITAIRVCEKLLLAKPHVLDAN